MVIEEGGRRRNAGTKRRHGRELASCARSEKEERKGGWGEGRQVKVPIPNASFSDMKQTDQLRIF